MPTLQDYLNLISQATYGKDVRQAIVDAIQTSTTPPLAKDVPCTWLASLTSSPDEITATDSVLIAIEKLIAKIRYDTVKNVTISSAKAGTTVTVKDQFNEEMCSFVIPPTGVIIPTGNCSTPATTASKVVPITDFSLNTGSIVGVKFSYANTANGPSMNVNNTGAKPIMNALTGKSVAAGDIMASMFAVFIYTGTFWYLINPCCISNSAEM